MNTSVTLTADEFKVLHNSLCDLNRFCQFKEIGEIVERIRKVALKSAYEQDNQAFETKHDYYHQFQQGNDLAAIWSIYDTPVHGFLKDHPYPDTAFVCYQGGHVPVFGATWGDIYRAADQAIRNSGDGHHIFIEAFELRNGNELHLVTGS